MIIKLIPPSNDDTAVHQLPEANMVVDPRPVGLSESEDEDEHEGFAECKFQVVVNDTVLTITRIDREPEKDPGWPYNMQFRVYRRNEFHYSFESTKYIYYGIDRECAPCDATEIIVKDGVRRIRGGAFFQCRFLSKITIPRTVTRIEEFAAFSGCTSLQYIKLPRYLQYIGIGTFDNCLSLKAIYIPPTVTIIGEWAFQNCKSLRILNIPDRVQYFRYDDLEGCNELLSDGKWLNRNRYNPLHNLCWNPSVKAHNIQQYIQQHYDNEERARTNDKPQFTALHLLAANPSVTGDMITAYLQLASDVAVMQDNKRATPLHMLCSVPSSFDGIGGAIEAFLGGCSEGKEAAFMTNDEGRTPFDCLLEKHFNELLFLENKTFGSLVTWWYDHCLDINLLAKDIDVNEN